MKKTNSKLNSLPLGICIGIILPTIVFCLVYFLKYYDMAVAKQIGHWKMLNAVIPKIVSLSAIANLIPFYIFLQTNRMQAVKGVVIGTTVMAVMVFLVFLIF